MSKYRSSRNISIRCDENETAASLRDEIKALLEEVERNKKERVCTVGTVHTRKFTGITRSRMLFGDRRLLFHILKTYSLQVTLTRGRIIRPFSFGFWGLCYFHFRHSIARMDQVNFSPPLESPTIGWESLSELMIAHLTSQVGQTSFT